MAMMTMGRERKREGWACMVHLRRERERERSKLLRADGWWELIDPSSALTSSEAFLGKLEKRVL